MGVALVQAEIDQYNCDGRDPFQILSIMEVAQLVVCLRESCTASTKPTCFRGGEEHVSKVFVLGAEKMIAISTE